MNNKKHGFSLLELSIVLVVVALIIGGVLVGQSMIKATQLRSVITDTEKWAGAVNQFKQKYGLLPGDFNDAVRFWGAAAGGTAQGEDATCIASFDTTFTPKKVTCNGNGDGRVNAGAPDDWHEVWRVWQHLSNAGLIEGMYTGEGSTAIGVWTNAQPKLGLSAPPSKYGRLTYALTWEGNPGPGHSNLLAGKYGNVFRIGTDTEMDDSVVTADEMIGLEAKFDDGKPGYGMIRAYKNSKRPDCVTTDDPVTAEYKNTDNRVCNIIVLLERR